RALRSMTDDDAGVMRVATGLAVDALRGARGTIETGETVFAIQIEGARVLPATLTGAQQVWNLDDGTTTTFDGVHGRLARDGTLRLWTVDGGTPRTIHDARATGGPATTRDGRYVAVWSAGARVRVVDVAAATIGPAFGDPSPSDTVVAISSDGRLVATGDAD